jgi:hypothetical protein
MTALVLLPNIEALVSAHLRAQSAVTAIADDRVYTALPRDVVMPCARVVNFYTQHVTQRPLWVATFYLQVDAWAATKAEAQNLSATLMAAMGEPMEGVHALGHVNGTIFDGWMDDPDDFYTPARPRWRFIARVTAHPLP